MADTYFDPALGAGVTANNIYLPGLQGPVWKDFSIQQAMVDPSYGRFKLFDWTGWTDLTSSTSNAWATLTQATAGTASLIDGPAGYGPLLELDCNSSTVTQGANLQFKSMRAYATTGMSFYFDCLLRLKDAATGPEFFLGWSDVDTTIIATSALTTGYKFGFKSTTDDNVLLPASGNNAVPTASSSSPYTLVDGAVTTDGTEWARLGARFSLDGRGACISVNGDEKANSMATSTFPTGAVICPSIVCQSSGTTDPLFEIAYLAVGYKRP